MTLHEKVLDLIENGRPGDGVDDHEPRLFAALRAVVELHQYSFRFGCLGCRRDPCPTLATIAEQLGIETGDQTP